MSRVANASGGVEEEGKLDTFGGAASGMPI
jgi:hypothetical protein